MDFNGTVMLDLFSLDSEIVDVDKNKRYIQMFDGTIIRCARSIQIRGEAQSDEMKNFAARIKSAVGIFYI
ncbi:hypothetical protein pdam_00024916 [Pocillopora damicornis]|uniref:Uncharacterized protein n=1 Tax=Pocillopora damicornis TaxID=46731 RepID=A0A3M6TV11_POCDA|nr:hypothetical protein pdam_00024916 [Pocillopora damicornis]